MMSPCEMCKLPGSPDEWFSRQTTCIPGRMSDLCVSVGVVALPADPDCDDVPTPELRDKTSTCGSGREREREEFKFGESRLKRKKNSSHYTLCNALFSQLFNSLALLD